MVDATMRRLGINYNTKLEIDITPNGANHTWVRLCKGWSNLSEALNEVIQQFSFLCDAGWGSSEVTGGQYTATITGVRYYGDPAQDYIFSEAVRFVWGEARKTTMRFTYGDGNVIEWAVTLANIVSNSGADANQASPISLTIHGNGPPTLIATQLRELQVHSVAGDSAGTTIITVDEQPRVNAGFVYQTGAAADNVVFEQDMTGWSPLINGQQLSGLTAGQHITVAEANSLLQAIGAGSAVIVTA